MGDQAKHSTARTHAHQPTSVLHNYLCVHKKNTHSSRVFHGNTCIEHSVSSEIDLPVSLQVSLQFKCSSTKSNRGESLITHLQRVWCVVCESTGLKAPQWCSITKTCLCLMLFVYQTQTIAFHGLQVYSALTMWSVFKHLWPGDKAANLWHTQVGGLGQMATGPVPLYECSTSTQAKDALQDKEGAVGKRTYPVLFAALSDLHKREQQRCLHQVLHLYFRCY